MPSVAIRQRCGLARWPRRSISSRRGWFGGVPGRLQLADHERCGLGLEADIQGGWQDSDKNCALTCSSIAAATLKQELPWFGHGARAAWLQRRSGAVLRRGGLAYGQVKNKITETIPGFAHGKFQRQRDADRLDDRWRRRNAGRADPRLALPELDDPHRISLPRSRQVGQTQLHLRRRGAYAESRPCATTCSVRR